MYLCESWNCEIFKKREKTWQNFCFENSLINVRKKIYIDTHTHSYMNIYRIFVMVSHQWQRNLHNVLMLKVLWLDWPPKPWMIVKCANVEHIHWSALSQKIPTKNRTKTKIVHLYIWFVCKLLCLEILSLPSQSSAKKQFFRNASWFHSQFVVVFFLSSIYSFDCY